MEYFRNHILFFCKLLIFIGICAALFLTVSFLLKQIYKPQSVLEDETKV
jgi:hypothetical protein